MEIKKLDELQKLKVVENVEDVELCWFTCLSTCAVTEVKDKPVELEKSVEQ